MEELVLRLHCGLNVSGTEMQVEEEAGRCLHIVLCAFFICCNLPNLIHFISFFCCSKTPNHFSDVSAATLFFSDSSELEIFYIEGNDQTRTETLPKRKQENTQAVVICIFYLFKKGHQV